MTETKIKETPKLSSSFGGTVEKDIPEDVVWIDDAFYIKKTRFGLYTSILKEPLGQHFITGATRRRCTYCHTLASKITARWNFTRLHSCDKLRCSRR